LNRAGIMHVQTLMVLSKKITTD